MLDIFFERYRKNNLNTNLKKNPLGKKNIENKGNSVSQFKEKMIHHIESIDFSKEIDSFIDEMDQLQQQIIEKPSIQLIEQYRSKIGFFLQNILDNHHAIPYYKGIKNKIELKVWSTINDELDEMARIVISGNVKGFAVLAKFNMIKGLIIDLKVGK